MNRDRTWTELILDYNSGRILTEDGRPVYEYKECEGKSPDANLKYCKQCGSVFERRYEQDVKKSVVYLYSELTIWSVPEDQHECCNTADCSCEGDDYAINY